MNKTQKNLLIAAAVAGLAAGAVVAKARVANDNQGSINAGKQVSSDTPVRHACNGCSGKTNSVAKI